MPNIISPIYDANGNLIHPAANLAALTQASQPVQATQNYTPIPQQSQANFTPVPVQSPTITPSPASPGENRIAQLTAPNINDPQYKNSRLRNVLNAIAGGFAGASGGPKVGYEVGQKLRDAKYDRAMTNYNNQLALAETQAKGSQNQFQRGYQTADLAERAKATQLLNVYRQGQLTDQDIKAQADMKRAETAEKRITELENYDKAKTAYMQFHMSPEYLAAQNKELAADQWISKQPKEVQDSLRDIDKQFNPNKYITPAEKASQSEQGKIDTDIKNLPQIGQISSAKSAATTGGRITAETTPENIEKQAELARAKNLAVPTSNQKDTVAWASTALPHIDTTLQLVNSMKDELGPIASRWNEFMAGKVGVGSKFSKLRTEVQLLDTAMGRIHGGARGGGSQTMLEHFKSLADAGQMDANALTAALNVYKEWVSGYSKLTDKDTGNPTIPESKTTPGGTTYRIIK